MARYQYQARDGRGELANGVVQAASLEEASKMLRAEGKFIVRLAAARDGVESETPGTFNPAHDRRVKRAEVILFTHQMAVMVETGVPISDALNSCAEQAANESFRAVLRDVAEHVQAGGDFSGALRRHPSVFPNVMVSLVKASEMSGTLGPMLDRISKYMAKDAQSLRQARGALMYPAFMATMAAGVTIFLLAFVLPKFTKIYATKNAVLPAPTRFLMAVSSGLVDFWYVWIALIVAAVVGVILARRVPAGRRLIDFIKLRSPVIGPIFLQLYISRATRTMGTMLNAGVSMLDMISIVRQVTQNVFFDDLWDDVDQRLRQGSQLSDPLFASPLMPKSISQMVYSGEKSGRLGQVLGRVAEYTEAEFDQTVKTATQFIEPVIIAVMGAVIGFVAISLLLPIFSVGRVMAGQ
jgi:type IV pilus assembly protein PilC